MGEKLSCHLAFREVKNIRDLGGMRTADGRRIAEGKLIRSGHLSDLKEEAAALAAIIDTVIDFRSPEERQRQPDADLTGTHAYAVPIVNSFRPGVTREEESDRDIIARLARDPEAARLYMCAMYEAFAADPGAVSGYRQFIRLLLEEHEKAVLWHCTAGKDRAGMGSVIVEEILGVPRNVIVTDYLLTNEYIANEITFLIGFAKKRMGIDGPEADRSLRYLFGADRTYIDAYYAKIAAVYGDYGTYIRDGLGLSDEEVETFRGKYLTVG